MRLGVRSASRVVALAFLGVLGPLTAPALALDGQGGISAGVSHTCAIGSNDKIKCWGTNAAGNGGSVAGPNAELGTYKAVSAGVSHTCAIDSSDKIKCWGTDTGGDVSGPNADGGTFKSVSASGSHTCAIGSNDKIKCWGTNVGAINGGTVAGPNAETGTFKAIATGPSQTCGIHSDGKIECWGDEFLGAGWVTGPNAETGTFKALSAGYYHTCAIRSNGKLACWGLNSGGGEVAGPNTETDTFKAVSAGDLHTCAIHSDDRIECWGTDLVGGAAVSGPNAETDTFKALSTFSHTCAIRSDDKIRCWGTNSAWVNGPNAETGAFGTPGGTTDPLEVTSTSDAGPGSLRRALSVAGSAEDADPRINISATGTISLQSALPALDSVVISGPGADELTVRRADAAPDFRIFNAPAGFAGEISDLEIENGREPAGGGGVLNLGDLTMRRVAVSSNRVPFTNSDSYGGGLLNGGALTVLDSTLTGNAVVGDLLLPSDFAWGGAIANAATGTLTVRNSTITANTASDAQNPDGGGIQNSGTATITNSTIVGNSGLGAGNLARSGGTITLSSTIVANPASGPNCDGTIVSNGHNLSDAAGCGLAIGAPLYDLIAAPLLGPLQPNGGPTQTMLPGLASPAIDAGVVGPGITTDQRGFARVTDLATANAPSGDGTDIGAVEHRDTDGDGIADLADNCQSTPNPGQQNVDGDGQGDACDADDDGDGISDTSDNCPSASNSGQQNVDSDGSGDACDPKDDRPAPSNCTVPAIKRGAKLGAVASALTDAGCTRGKKTRKFSSKVKKRRLIKLKATAGAVFAAGAAVDVVVSKGPR